MLMTFGSLMYKDKLIALFQSKNCCFKRKNNRVIPPVTNAPIYEQIYENYFQTHFA